MRGLAIGVASLAALALVSAVWAAPPPSPVLAQPVGGPTSSDPAAASGPGATVRLSTSKAGARPVIVTIRIVVPLRCGVPFGSPVVVSLPRMSLVPQAIASSAVLINGKQSSKVTVSAHSVTVGVPTVHGVTCNSISDGPELLTFTSAAKLGNARKPGIYVIKVRRGSSTYAASVTIS